LNDNDNYDEDNHDDEDDDYNCNDRDQMQSNEYESTSSKMMMHRRIDLMNIPYSNQPYHQHHSFNQNHSNQFIPIPNQNNFIHQINKSDNNYSNGLPFNHNHHNIVKPIAKSTDNVMVNDNIVKHSHSVDNLYSQQHFNNQQNWHLAALMKPLLYNYVLNCQQHLSMVNNGLNNNNNNYSNNSDKSQQSTSNTQSSSTKRKSHLLNVFKNESNHQNNRNNTLPVPIVNKLVSEPSLYHQIENESSSLQKAISFQTKSDNNQKDKQQLTMSRYQQNIFNNNNEISNSHHRIEATSVPVRRPKINFGDVSELVN
jgi:hypothetical protein